MAVAVLWDGRCVLKGSLFLIDTLWGTTSWQTLCCGTGAVFSRELCPQGKYFLIRHSLGHLLMADSALSIVRCVLKRSIF